MTLILTVVTQRNVVQTSDLRLTGIPAGKLADDLAVKQAFVQTDNASISLAYTGVTDFGSGSRRELRADRIILNHLAEASAGSLNIDELLQELRDKIAPAVVSHISIPEAQRRLTIVVCGYVGTTPLAAAITNWENLETGRAEAVRPRFQCRWWRLRADANPERSRALMIHGATMSLTAAIKSRIRNLLKKRFFQNADGPSIAKEAVALIRAAADSPGVGHVIGKSCVSTCIPCDPAGESFSQFHPSTRTRYCLYPHAIIRGNAYKDFETYVHSGQGPPSWSRYLK